MLYPVASCPVYMLETAGQRPMNVKAVKMRLMTAISVVQLQFRQRPLAPDDCKVEVVGADGGAAWNEFAESACWKAGCAEIVCGGWLNP